MAEAEKPIVEVVGVSKKYGDGGGKGLLKRKKSGENVETVVRALDDVSLKIYPKEFVLIVGPSGCGKTTLLNMIGLLDDPTSGVILIGGDITTAAKEKRKNEIRKNIGFVFQDNNLIEFLTAIDNVWTGIAPLGIPEKIGKITAKEVLEKVGLGDRLDHLPSQLSGGQKQRVTIARAIAKKPLIILADEPTGNLNKEFGDSIFSLLEKIVAEGNTVVMVTHEERYIDGNRSASSGKASTSPVVKKRVVRMEDGKITSDTRGA